MPVGAILDLTHFLKADMDPGPYRLRLSHEAPINKGLNVRHSGSGVARRKRRYLAGIAVVKLIEASSLNYRDRNIRVLGEPLRQCQSRRASPDNLERGGMGHQLVA